MNTNQTYTKTELLRKAIACYQKVGMYEDICRCLSALGDYEEAAELYQQHGEPWQVAWMYAEDARRFYRARAMALKEIPINEFVDELSRDLILERCDAETGPKPRASQVLDNVVEQFRQIPFQHRPRIEAWAVTIAQKLMRVDLVAMIYARSYTSGTPEAEIRWEAWALSVLGDATGVPTTPFIDPGTPFEFETVTVNERGTLINRRRHQATQLIERVNGVEIAMVHIPGGMFMMGSPEDEPEREFWQEGTESPQHLVTIEPFYLAKYLVTQAQWQAVMGNNPSEFKGDNRPVEQVSWNESVEFCQRLSDITGNQYQLPSEAQWEYACRAGTTTPFYFGPTITTELANFNGNYPYGSAPEGVYRQETTDVGSFPPNAFGLYDMHGNLWEWCADRWHSSYEGAPTDGSVWEEQGEAGLFVVRSGSWDDYARWARSANRYWVGPAERGDNCGGRPSRIK